MEKPLVGIHLCCTGVTNAMVTEIQSKSRKMGAAFSLDLVSTVTHMVVATPDTPKYEYALRKRPDIVFLTVDFVPRLYDKWLAGDEIDIAAEVRDHGERRPFFNLKISFTNMPADMRSEYTALVKQNAGLYNAAVSATTDVLVAATRPEGQKYKFAVQKKIPVVHTTWLQACLKRHAFVGLSEFSIELDEPELADRLARIPRKRGPKAPTADAGAPEKRPISLVRRTRSENTWNSIMEDVVPPAGQAPASNSAGPKPPFELVSEGPDAPPTTTSVEESPEERLFEGQVFLFYGFPAAKLKFVEQYITSRGGRITAAVQTLPPTHFVVPFDLKPADLPPTPSSAVLVTNWYIDESIHYKQLQPPDTCVYSRYLGHTIHHAGAHIFKSKKITTSGFTGMQSTHVERFITTLGATLLDTLEADRDLLVVTAERYHAVKGNPRSPRLPPTEKMRAAAAWKIKIVPVDWLFDIDKWPLLGLDGKRPPEDDACESRKRKLAGDKEKAGDKENAGARVLRRAHRG